MTPQEEAIQILGKVVQDLTSSNRDLKLALRQCQHACQLLGWGKQQEWFQREIAGYPSNFDVPRYRKVRGKLIWYPQSSGYDRIHNITKALVLGPDPEDKIESTVLDCRAGVDWLLLVVQKGYREDTSESKSRWSNREKKSILLRRIRYFEATDFEHTIAEIERIAFDFASQSYYLLRYGNTISDIWLDYQKQVDEVPHRFSWGNHLDAIRSGIQSVNPESWRSAVFACRDLLSDVANYLWRDERETYILLKGDGRDDKLKVTQDRTANRFRAYLHQKGFGEKHRKYLESAIDRLADSIRSLLGFQSIAHAPVSKEDARAIVLATHFILGELIIKTDMTPIEKYGDPAVDFQSSRNENTADEQTTEQKSS